MDMAHNQSVFNPETVLAIETMGGRQKSPGGNRHHGAAFCGPSYRSLTKDCVKREARPSNV